jgi:uncharacterized protein YutE (UPF0331/DUF86 family)
VSIDLDVLAERTTAVERHLARVSQRLPATPQELVANTDASDAVILHLWQATQIVLDVALGVCAEFRLGAPAGYADAFVRLGAAQVVSAPLARRLIGAAGFRNLVAHAYDIPARSWPGSLPTWHISKKLPPRPV